MSALLDIMQYIARKHSQDIKFTDRVMVVILSGVTSLLWCIEFSATVVKLPLVNIRI